MNCGREGEEGVCFLLLIYGHLSLPLQLQYLPALLLKRLKAYPRLFIDNMIA